MDSRLVFLRPLGLRLLIYSTELYPQVMWGRGSKDNIIKRLKDLITKEDSRYSSRFIYVAEASRIVAMSFCEPRSWTRVLSS